MAQQIISVKSSADVVADGTQQVEESICQPLKLWIDIIVASIERLMMKQMAYQNVTTLALKKTNLIHSWIVMLIIITGCRALLVY